MTKNSELRFRAAVAMLTHMREDARAVHGRAPYSLVDLREVGCRAVDVDPSLGENGEPSSLAKGVGFALYTLRNMGYLDQPMRGLFRLTDRGEYGTLRWLAKDMKRGSRRDAQASYRTTDERS